MFNRSEWTKLQHKNNPNFGMKFINKRGSK